MMPSNRIQVFVAGALAVVGKDLGKKFCFPPPVPTKNSISVLFLAASSESYDSDGFLGRDTFLDGLDNSPAEVFLGFSRQRASILFSHAHTTTLSSECHLYYAPISMWLRNCGMLPVVGPDRKLIGVVTDRDICVAMATRNRLPGELNVSEIATRKVFTCKPNDEMLEALHMMADNHKTS